MGAKLCGHDGTESSKRHSRTPLVYQRRARMNESVLTANGQSLR